MSFHKWKVFKGRFLGFENYNRILGDISSFWIFIFGLLLLIFSYWLWSEFKDKYKNKFLLSILVILISVFAFFIINIQLDSTMLELGDDDFLNSIMYIFYYSFFAILSEVGLGLIIAFGTLSKIKRKTIFSNDFIITIYNTSSNGGSCFFYNIWQS